MFDRKTQNHSIARPTEPSIMLSLALLQLNTKPMLNNATAFAGFSVDALETAKDFYQNTLGLKAEETYMGVLYLHTKGNHPMVVYPKAGHTPASYTVLNFYVDDLEGTVSGLKEKGVRFEQYQDGPIRTDEKDISRDEKGPDMAWFKDPAGNIIALIEK